MTVEILYSDLCYLHGDNGNVDYLVSSLPDADFKFTSLNDRPFFADHDVDFIYLGSITENQQKRVLARLVPLKDRFRALVDLGTTVLFTGNALELLGTTLTFPDGSVLEGLGISRGAAIIKYPARTNSLELAEILSDPASDLTQTSDSAHNSAFPLKFVGFTSRFSHSYFPDDTQAFLRIVKGFGNNPGSLFEGVHINRLYATNLIGPILPYNPYFTQMLLAPWVDRPAFWDTAVRAFEERLADFEKDGVTMC